MCLQGEDSAAATSRRDSASTRTARGVHKHDLPANPGIHEPVHGRHALPGLDRLMETATQYPQRCVSSGPAGQSDPTVNL
jgi:hypothetical protein